MNNQNLNTSKKDSIGDLIETCDFPDLYRTYAWKRDLWQNGFPEICRLEREVGDAARAGTLSEEHLKAIARWGGLPNIERIRAPAPIRIALFEDGKVARWARESPENAIRVLGGQFHAGVVRLHADKFAVCRVAAGVVALKVVPVVCTRQLGAK